MSNAIAKRNGELTLPGFTLTATGLDVEGEPSFEQWQQAGQSLRQLDGALHWWIGDWLRFGKSQKDWGEMYPEAVEKLGFAEKTLRNYVWLADKFELSLRRDDLDKSHHEIVAAVDEPERSEWLDKAAAKNWPCGELRGKLHEAKLMASRKDNPMPVGMSDVIYADPPWQFNSNGDPRSMAVDRQYLTMSIEKICDLHDAEDRRVVDVAAADAVLMIWVPSFFVAESMAVINAWGFEYRSQIVWNKERHNPGHYTSVRHENLFICVRGNGLPIIKRPESVITEPPTGVHSQKPTRFYDLIEAMYPDATHLELFARNTRPRWTSWGNEVNPTDPPRTD